MVYHKLLVFLSLFQLSLAVPATPDATAPSNVYGKSKTYDYIVGAHHSSASTRTPLTLHQVVGGGTGGLAIAERLAETPSLSVAVIEAGGFYEQENGNISVVPGYDVTYAYPSGPTPPVVDWGFFTEPQKVIAAQSPHGALSVKSTSDASFFLRVIKTVKSITRKARLWADREY